MEADPISAASVHVRPGLRGPDARTADAREEPPLFDLGEGQSAAYRLVEDAARPVEDAARPVEGPLWRGSLESMERSSLTERG